MATESIQLRTTTEQSGDYRVFDSAKIAGDQAIKGLAIHTDITSRLDSAEYVELELSDKGAVSLVSDRATSATVQFSTDGPAVRHGYISPDMLRNFGEFEFNGTETDLSQVPDVAISSIEPSTEDAYELDKERRGSAEDAADALLGDGSNESSDQMELSDEEVGIVDE